MVEWLINLIAPHTCVVCGSEGSLLCDWCAPDAISIVPSRCYRCKTISQDSEVCGKCRPKTGLKHVWVRGVYDGAAKELVYRLKFERAKAAAKTIADLMDESVPFLDPETVVTFVPTAARRIRLRGYDQTKLIARSFAHKRGLRLQPLLIRHGHTRQVGASRTQRLVQAQQNYSLKSDKNLPKHVLLIDDITTTGASLEACVKILRKAGVRHVDAAVFAQKQ